MVTLVGRPVGYFRYAKLLLSSLSSLMLGHIACVAYNWSVVTEITRKKGKVLPYSLPSVGPGADPDV